MSNSRDSDISKPGLKRTVTPWIQTAEQMCNSREFIKPAHRLMEQQLGYLQRQVFDTS